MAVNFAQLLESYANTALLTMVKGRSMKPPSQAKAKLIAALVEVLSDEESIAQAMAQLPPSSQAVLALLRQRGGQASIASLEAQSLVNGVTQFDDALHELMRRALVFYVREGHTKHELWKPLNPYYRGYPDRRYEIFALPAALERVDAPENWGRGELKRFKDGVRETLEPPPDALLRDVLAVMRVVEQRKIRPRKAGGLPDGDIIATAKQLNDYEDKDEREGRAGFLHATLWQCRLLREQDGRLQPSESLEGFLALPLHEQVRQLFEGWLAQEAWSEFARVPEFVPAYGTKLDPGGYNSDVPAAQALQKGRRTIVGVLKREKCVDDWFSFASLLDTIKAENAEFLIPDKRRYYYGDKEPTYEGFFERGQDRWEGKFKRKKDWEKVEGRFIARVLMEPLRWLGMVALAMDEDGVQAFRLTDVGAHVLGVRSHDFSRVEAKPFLVVQPNFEIIAYTDGVPTALLFQLGKFADRTSSDKVSLYRVSRESVYRGLQAGLTGRAILDFLTQHSQTPVPQNVTYSLDDWQRLHERVTVYRSGTLIEADSEEELDALLAQLPAESFTRLAPTWALLNSAQKQDALQRLIELAPKAVAFDYTLPIEATFTVTEDLEIEIPRDNLDLFVQAEVESFADFDYRSARLVCYKITRESVQRASKQGIPFSRIMEFLERHGQKPLPANARLSIRGWSGLFNDMALEPAITLATKEKANLDDIMAVPHLREMFVRRVSDHVAFVKPECVEQLRAELERRGIELKSTVLTQVRASVPAPKPPLPPLQFHTKSVRRHRRVELSKLIKEPTAQPTTQPTSQHLQYLKPRETQQLLEQAIAEKRRVMIDYYSQSGGRRKVRKVDPLVVYPSGSNYYLEGYCHFRKDDRVFKVSNIMGIQVLDETFEVDEGETDEDGMDEDVYDDEEDDY